MKKTLILLLITITLTTYSYAGISFKFEDDTSIVSKELHDWIRGQADSEEEAQQMIESAHSDPEILALTKELMEQEKATLGSGFVGSSKPVKREEKQ